MQFAFGIELLLRVANDSAESTPLFKSDWISKESRLDILPSGWNLLCFRTVGDFDNCMQLELKERDPEKQPPNEYPNTYAPIPVNGSSCVHTGLKHAHLYKLLGDEGSARNFVRVVSLKNPKARHGKTLFHIGDMLRYLDHLAEQQGAGKNRNALVLPNARDHSVQSL